MVEITGNSRDNRSLRGTNAPDLIWGHAGNDVIWGLLGGDTVYGDDRFFDESRDADYIVLGGGNDWAFGGGDRDTIRGDAGRDTIDGGNGNDRIVGGSGDDSLHGSDGSDFISGGSNNDTVYGGDGNDRLFGEHGNDYLSDSYGADWVSGGEGNDTLYSSRSQTAQSRDTLIGGNGDDLFDVYGDHKLIYAGGDNDLVNIHHDDNWVFLGSGNDTVEADSSSQTGTRVLGGPGDDYISAPGLIWGHSGNDTIEAGYRSTDRIFAGSGDDVILGVGGRDEDTISGGTGSDTYIVTDQSFNINDVDTILDFADGEDTISFEDYPYINEFSDISVLAVGRAVYLRDPDGDYIVRLMDTTINQVTRDDFDF